MEELDGGETVDWHGVSHSRSLVWGLSGTSVQYLEGAKHLNVEWLLEVRLLVAGFLTIILAYMQDGSAS